MNCPCKDCTKRKENCHSSCAEYKEFQEFKRNVNQQFKDYYGTLQMARTGHYNIAHKKSPKPRKKRRDK